MALETLKNVSKIDGFDVKRVAWNHPIGNPIEIDDKSNAIAFRIQNGPIKEVGVNGCQVDTLIETARMILFELNTSFPCRENACALTKLDEALLWLSKRKADREFRGVEGTSAE